MERKNPEKKFRILEELGKGSFSKVYKVLNRNNGKIYALKKVDLTSL